MAKKIRVGILGLGRIGKMHARNILTMKEFEVVVGVDPFLTEGLEQEMKKEMGCRSAQRIRKMCLQIRILTQW